MQDERQGERAAMLRIEIGTVAGDARIVGGATQALLYAQDVPVEIPLAWGESNIARITKVPGTCDLYIPAGVAVKIGKIAGNGQVLHVAEHVELEQVRGNLLVVDAPRGVQAEAGGKVVLDTALGSQAEFAIQANGSITLRTHGEISARFAAQTAQGVIRTRLPLMVERGRRRNLVGVIGRGDAAVTLRSQNGSIMIIAAENSSESNERTFTMDNEYSAKSEKEDKGQQAEGTRTWEGGFGKRRFRAQWDRGPGRATFHFQGPFTENKDPDGLGVPFEPDFGFEWERGRGARAYGEYEERWDEMREKAEKAARRAAKEARKYAERTSRHVRDMDWDALERDIRAAVEKAMDELEEALRAIRGNWEKRQSKGEPGKLEQGKQGSKAHRVRIEYDHVEDPLADTASESAAEEGHSYAPRAHGIAREARDAQRRAILEELRTESITLEEAERRLIELD
jgi:hypothetical protein